MNDMTRDEIVTALRCGAGASCEGCPYDEIFAVEDAKCIGETMGYAGVDEWCCSACGFVITTEGSWDKPTKKYCEDCGAKMDGGADNG